MKYPDFTIDCLQIYSRTLSPKEVIPLQDSCYADNSKGELNAYCVEATWTLVPSVVLVIRLYLSQGIHSYTV